MKLRKTRIKKIEKANGSVEYVAQYKTFFGWKDFKEAQEYYMDEYLIYEEASGCTLAEADVCEDIESCKAFIEYYIRRVKHINASEVEVRVDKVSYEEYP